MFNTSVFGGHGDCVGLKLGSFFCRLRGHFSCNPLLYKGLAFISVVGNWVRFAFSLSIQYPAFSIQNKRGTLGRRAWIPASAGMTRRRRAKIGFVFSAGFGGVFDVSPSIYIG